MFRKIFYTIILLSADKPTFWEKIGYLVKLVMSFGMVAWLLDKCGLWFQDNEMFFTGLIMAMFINMVFGYAYHKKIKDFHWKKFFLKNIEMWGIILLVYPFLEVISHVAGNNILAETFKITLQISTLLYPGSKALKNAYLLSEKKFPPGFVMNRLYNFEKTGDLNELINGKQDNYDNNETGDS
ncbi:hypothetical protein [Flavobacterium sp. NRK1]|uniref:hypothetical protein n=1 Tax=Flavobacterium sp. NRK1 TaxID=2954929 RepID=UPI0020925523|nr:hypothetical protein [Flavobacterium sp. NRK1]MCO6149050.1 hypothetical protein [Flavobacterium sp. NRK1]